MVFGTKAEKDLFLFKIEKNILILILREPQRQVRKKQGCAKIWFGTGSVKQIVLHENKERKKRARFRKKGLFI